MRPMEAWSRSFHSIVREWIKAKSHSPQTGNTWQSSLMTNWLLLRVSNSRVVAKMQPPSIEDPKQKRRTSSSDHVVIYAWTQDMKFSPDGTELAAVSTHRGTRLLCWNQRAKLVVNQPFQTIERKAFWENDVHWLPEGNAWLVGWKSGGSRDGTSLAGVRG